MVNDPSSFADSFSQWPGHCSGWHRSDFFGWKGGPEGWDTVRQSPVLEAASQMHYQPQGGKEHNVPDEFIANVQRPGGMQAGGA